MCSDFSLDTRRKAKAKQKISTSSDRVVIIMLTQGYLLLSGNPFQMLWNTVGFVFVAYETTTLYYLVHVVVESPYGSVLKQRTW